MLDVPKQAAQRKYGPKIFAQPGTRVSLCTWLATVGEAACETARLQWLMAARQE